MEIKITDDAKQKSQSFTAETELEVAEYNFHGSGSFTSYGADEKEARANILTLLVRARDEITRTIGSLKENG